MNLPETKHKETQQQHVVVTFKQTMRNSAWQPMDMTPHWGSAATADHRHLRKPPEGRGLREPDLMKVLNDRHTLDHASESGYDIHHD